MTAFTSVAEAAFVRIVLAVTSMTVRGCRVLIQWPGVAIRAAEIQVTACEKKFRVGIVMKQELLPTRFVVTTRAAFSKCALVTVVVTVAGKALAGCLTVALAGLVTALAACIFVLAGQQVIGPCVVEGFLVQVDDLRITTLVLCMTVIALRFLEAPVVAPLGVYI